MYTHIMFAEVLLQPVCQMLSMFFLLTPIKLSSYLTVAGT